MSFKWKSKITKRKSLAFLFKLMFAVLTSQVLVLSMCTTNEKDIEVNLAGLVPQQIDGWKITGLAEHYDRESIFEYIDGAGEVYRQYGFRECVVSRLSKQGQPKITIEIFDMSSSEDAFGIFSHIREEPEAGFGQGSQYAGRILYFWQNRFFVSIYPEIKTSETDQIVSRSANQIIQAIGNVGLKPPLVSFLPEEDLLPGSVRYFHLHPSLNYHYYLAPENILNLNDKTNAVLACYKPGKSHLLVIQYPKQVLTQAALKHFTEVYLPEIDESGLTQLSDGNWVAAQSVDNFIIVVFESATAEKARSLSEAAKEKLAQWLAKKGKEL